jgi:hypothetical protein
MLINPKLSAASQYRRKKGGKKGKSDVLNQKETTDARYKRVVEELEYARLHKKCVKKLVKELECIKKKRKKYKDMAVAMGMPIKERFGVPVLDIVNALIEAAKLSRTLIGEDTLRLLLDVLVSLYNIYKSVDWKGVIINLTNLLSKFLSTECVETALLWFRNSFTCFAQADGDTGWRSVISHFFDTVDSTINDTLWSNIEVFVQKLILLYTSTRKLVSFESIDFKIVHAKFNDFKSLIPECQDIINLFFQGYEFITGNWKHIVTGDWSKLSLGKEESRSLETEVRVLETAYNYVVANQEIALKEHYDMTPDQYETRMTKALKKAENLMTQCTSIQQKLCISQFIKSLTEKQHNLWARKADAPTKEQAWAVKLSGPSNCGKSTMVNLLCKTILNAYGHDPKNNGLTVITNIDERYESSIKPSHKVIIADDVANNANSKPNYDRILNYVNTVPRALEKAGVTDKGNQYPCNDALIVTTNVESLRAEECSACPESILRRFNLDVEVHIKPQFATDYGGLKIQDDIRFDVYNLILKRFSSYDRESGLILWDIIPRLVWNPANRDDFPALCRFVASDIAAHKVRQQKQSEMQESLRECAFCEVCQVPQIVCTCCPMAETQSLATMWNEYSTNELWRARRTLTSISSFFTDCYKNTLFWQRIFRDRVFITNLICLFITSSFIGLFVGRRCMQLTTVSIIIFGILYYKQLILEIDTELQRRSDRLSSLCEDLNDHLRNNSLKYFAGGAVIFTLYGFYKILKPLIKSQDTSTFRENMLGYWEKHLDAPINDECRVVTQDERNYKEGYSRLPPKMNHLQKTCPGPQLHESVMKSLRHVTVYSKGKRYCTTNGIMVHSNVILVPSHLLPDTFPFCIETTTTPGVPSASTKDQKLTQDFVYIDRENDYALVHLPTSPASTSYLEHFAEEYPDFISRPTTLLWKSPKNEIRRSDHVARLMQCDLKYRGTIEEDGSLWGVAQNSKIYTVHKGKGLVANMQFKGFGGLCGGLWCDRTKGIIYGIHVAGFLHTTVGLCNILLKSQIQKGLDKLKTTSPCMMVNSTSEVIIDPYDKGYTIVDKPPLFLHPESVGKDAITTYIGTVLKDGMELTSNARPPYIPTPFEGIAEEFGPSKHRPPKNPNSTEKAISTLNKLVSPVQHYEGDTLSKAIHDYKEQTLNIIRQNRDKVTTLLRIYSQDEALNGTNDGVLSGIPNSTSAGFGLDKSKLKCLKRDPFDESLPLIPREFNEDHQKIQDEIDYTFKCWSDNRRSECIYKSSSKVNELLPNKKAHEKVRKFYGGQFANLVASRCALGGVPLFMQEFWNDTECMVGINPMSKQWNDFYKHLTKFGDDRMIAGDFASFDTTMAAQITTAAAKIIMSWYEEVGCTVEELKMVQGALSDIVNPNILFEGQLYRFANGNPSGNLITVQMNSICNSLMMRYVYYSIFPSVKETFNQNVVLGTYGDDNAMGIKKHCTWFNHTACQKAFENVGIKYTMAEKDAVSVPYITINDISFLKRSFVYHPELQTIVAPIEEDSTLKRFYYIKKPNECPLSFEEQFGCYTDGAFRDMYLKGREVYNNFVDKMKRIVSKNQTLKGHVDFIPYDTMTQILKPDYSDQYIPRNKKLFTESMGCFSDLTSMTFDDSCDESIDSQ